MCFLLALGCSMAFAVPASAHSAFKKQMEAKYPNMKISCNACHVDKQPKTTRNKYGQLLSKTIGNKTLTTDWKAKKGAEKKDYETKVMVPAFNKAFETVKAMTVHDLIEAGMFDGITNREEEDADKKADESSSRMP